MTDRKEEPQHKKRKPYRTPRLTTHGDLRTLAKAKGSTNNDGGGGKPNSKAGGPAG